MEALQSGSKTLPRLAVLVFGVVVYTLFLATFLGLIGFVEGVVLPWTTSDGVRASGAIELVLVNTGLVALFAIQHTIMARRSFKRWWTRVVPAAAERSVFVLVTCLVLALMVTQWRTMPESADLWSVESRAIRVAMHSIGWGGWVLALVSTFLINHFHLFGLQQSIAGFRGAAPKGLPFRVRSAYRLVRHPLYLGFLLAFWVTPDMSVGRLTFVGLMSLYLCLGVRMEERSLVQELGADYIEYQRRVPALIPLLGRPGAGRDARLDRAGAR